jgi:hypothetical protein
MRVQSRKESSKGGWIHDIDQAPVAAKAAPMRVADVPALAERMFRDPRAAPMREQLALTLGVSIAALAALRVGIGWDNSGREYAALPSLGEDGRPIGISRRYSNGVKKTLSGTGNGIFAAERWYELAGPICVAEGASDVAALHTHGFPALGRPSNVAGADLMRHSNMQITMDYYADVEGPLQGAMDRLK